MIPALLLQSGRMIPPAEFRRLVDECIGGGGSRAACETLIAYHGRTPPAQPEQTAALLLLMAAILFRIGYVEWDLQWRLRERMADALLTSTFVVLLTLFMIAAAICEAVMWRPMNKTSNPV
jgi:hypothetical protein